MKNLELTEDQKNFLNYHTKGIWTYNADTGLVDVKGNVDIPMNTRHLTDFKGVRFGKVDGYFDCSYNKLTSLEGAPQEVRGYFNCGLNQLTSLEGAPQEVGKYFVCNNNNLTSLKGGPQKVGGYFVCRNNKLTSLEGAPQEVGKYFSCRGNKLTSLAGAPQEVGGYFSCGTFKLEMGECNPKGWLKVLREGRPKAQKLILSIFSAEVLNKEIQKDPAGMIMKLKEVWNDGNFKEIRSKLVWPKGYGDSADLVGDLDDIGF